MKLHIIFYPIYKILDKAFSYNDMRIRFFTVLVTGAIPNICLQLLPWVAEKFTEEPLTEIDIAWISLACVTLLFYTVFGTIAYIQESMREMELLAKLKGK